MRKTSQSLILTVLLALCFHHAYSVISEISVPDSKMFLQVGSEAIESSQLKTNADYYSTTPRGGSRNRGSPIADFLFGFIFICLAFPMLWFNERRQVKTAALISAANKDMVEGDAKSPKPEHNLKLVYLSGETRNSAPILDQQFNVQVDNAVKLIRNVEMYQWVELTRKSDHHTHYEYVKEWRSVQISSSTFHESHSHTNPELIYKGDTILGQAVHLGGYLLADSQKEKLANKKPVTLTADQIKSAQNSASKYLNDYMYNDLKQEGNVLIARKKRDHQDYDIGDLRICWEIVPCGPATILAQQIVNEKGQITLRKWNPEKLDVPYGQKTENEEERTCMLCSWCCCISCIDSCMQKMSDGTLETVLSEPKSKDEILKQMDEENTTITKVFRVVGWLLLWFGIWLLFSPIIFTLSWIPLVGYFVASGFGFVACLFALILSAVLALLTIALAWIRYRPLFGLCLLGAVLLGVAVIVFINKPETAAAVVTQAATNSTTNGNSTVTTTNTTATTVQ